MTAIFASLVLPCRSPLDLDVNGLPQAVGSTIETVRSAAPDHSGGEDTGFGLGWRIATDEDHGVVYHQPGGGPGISTWIYLLPEEKLVLVALSNLTRAPVGDAINLAAEHFGRRP